MIFTRIAWILGTAWFLFLTAQFFHYRGRSTAEIIVFFFLVALLIGCYELYRWFKKRIPLDEALTQPFRISLALYVAIIWLVVICAVLFTLTAIYPSADTPLWITYLGALRIITSIIGGWMIFAICWYALGRFCLRIIGLDTALTTIEKTLYAIGIGVVFCGLYFYLIALIHVVTLGALALFFTMSALCGMLFWRDIYHGLFARRVRIGVVTTEPETNFLTGLMLLCVFIVLVVFLNNGGYYLFRGDELRTYINVPATYIAHGGLVSFPYDLHNNGSNAFAFIYIPLLMVRGDLPNFASLFFYIATICITGLIAYQLHSKRASLWAMFFSATIPWSFVFLFGAKVDFMMTFVALAGIAALLHAWRVNQISVRMGLLATSGFLIGFSGMIKYSALLLIPVALVVAFIWSSAPRLSQRIVEVCFYGLCIGAIIFPWTMRNILETGNPAYPYGSYKVGYYQELSSTALATYESFYDHKASVRQVLLTTNPWWKNIWILVTNQSNYPGNVAGVLFFGLLPGLLLARSAIKRNYRAWVAMAAIIVSVFISWLFLITLQLWYVMFIFPLWCLVYAPIVAEKFPKRARVLLASILMIIFIERFTFSHFFLSQYYSGTQTKKEFNEMLGEANDIAEYLNTSILPSNPNYVILPVQTKGFELLITDNHKHYFNYNFDPASYRTLNTWIFLALKHTSDEALVADIQSHHVTHILYDQQDIDAFRPVWCYEGEHSEMCLLYNRLTGRFQNIIPYLTVIHETPEWTIYGI